ncbi:aminoglycoside phosphotransferase family protein [Streptomyces natalensis]|uniref:aminoglycoside phosphotransferase family protein n=1 Tax=Streptomyces natalensis TaxID=68242 RepID=UPI0007C4BCD1
MDPWRQLPGRTSSRVTVPAGLAAFLGEDRQEWVAAVPELAAGFLDGWRLRLDGPAAHGMNALVLPVQREDGTPAALKLQPPTRESVGEPKALRAWGGTGAVILLDHDAESGTMLLERLDARRSLARVPDAEAALLALSELMARLLRTPAPTGLRTLTDISAALLDAAPRALLSLADPLEHRLLLSCAGALREVSGEAGALLLHGDLHCDNVLAPLPGSDRQPWRAIDPKPLVGDPGFDLLPAIGNRWEERIPARQVLRRFDLMTDALALDRRRAVRWTLGRVLQNALRDIEDGQNAVAPGQAAMARLLLGHDRDTQQTRPGVNLRS